MTAKMTRRYSYDGVGMNDYVAQRIRAIRLASNVNQSDVGARLIPPRSYAAVSDIERGKTAITVDLLMCFAVLFDKPLGCFLPDSEATS